MRTLTPMFVGIALFVVTAPKEAPNAIAQGIATEAHSNAANMIGAAEAMPAEKYGYKPTEQQISFGELIYHATVANNTLCGAISGEHASELAVKAGGAKAALIEQMKQSFAFCDKAFATIDQGRIGDEVQVLGRNVTKAWILFHLALDYGDHYSQAAMMLRLNGIAPPSAQRRAPGK